MGKNCPDPQRAIGVLQRRRVPLRKGERQRIGGAVYKQPSDFFECARIDADGVFVPTGSECAEGVDYSGHKREWGYHPLVVSLANTQEPLFLVNRTGARPSHEGAA